MSLVKTFFIINFGLPTMNILILSFRRLSFTPNTWFKINFMSIPNSIGISDLFQLFPLTSNILPISHLLYVSILLISLLPIKTLPPGSSLSLAIYSKFVSEQISPFSYTQGRASIHVKKSNKIKNNNIFRIPSPGSKENRL